MPAQQAAQQPARALRYREAFQGSSQAPETTAKTFEQRIQRFLAEERENIGLEYKATSKVCVVGPSGVGKSCLMLRHCEGTFSDNYKSTIGVDFMASRFNIHDVRFILQIWDTAGQERFRSVSSAFFRGAMSCIACFDLTDAESLPAALLWARQVRSENAEPVALFLVGCKADLPPAVPREEAEAAAKELGAEYAECSAREGTGVDALFERVALVAFDRCLAAALPAPSPAGASGSLPAPASPSSPPAPRFSIGKILPTTRTPPKAQGAGGPPSLAESLGAFKLRAASKLSAAQKRASQSQCCS